MSEKDFVLLDILEVDGFVSPAADGFHYPPLFRNKLLSLPLGYDTVLTSEDCIFAHALVPRLAAWAHCVWLSRRVYHDRPPHLYRNIRLALAVDDMLDMYRLRYGRVKANGVRDTTRVVGFHALPLIPE